MAILKRRDREVTQINSPECADGVCFSSPSELLAYAEKLGISTEPTDVERIAEMMGIRVRSYPMNKQMSGYLKRDDAGWVIGVNSLHHPRRQRFTLAHELGHFLLHRSDIKEIQDTALFRAEDFGVAGIERDANIFAAELLMPIEKFRKAVKDENGAIDQIASRFGVSSLAVSIRAKELGYREREA